MSTASAADRVRLEASWKAALLGEFEKSYMQRLREFLQGEKQAKKVIYPKGERIFAALDLTPLPDVKVIIIGQDPYHGPGQAHGLCFSVRPGVALPPSLVNIFREINDDLGTDERRLYDDRGCLESWQGVLLLNAGADRGAGAGRLPTRARVGKPSPTRSCRCSTASARVWSSCCGAATHRRRAPSWTAAGTASSPPRIRRPCPPTEASSAASTSPPPTPICRSAARHPSTGLRWADPLLAHYRHSQRGGRRCPRRCDLSSTALAIGHFGSKLLNFRPQVLISKTSIQEPSPLPLDASAASC